MVRAYTIWNLVSSIGLIIGVVYGVSLIDLPEITKMSRNQIRKNFSKDEPQISITKSLQIYKASQILICEVLDKLRMEVGELDKKCKGAKTDIAQTNNQTFDTIRNEEMERYDVLRNEVGELNEKFQNAKKDISLLNNKTLDMVTELKEELQNARKDITLIKNQKVQCVKKKEYETVVIMI